SDGQATLIPTPYTFIGADNGMHVFSGTLKTAGLQSITAADAANSFSASQTGILVTPATAASLIVNGFPTPTTAGVAQTFTVTARDAFGNTATTYTGSMSFSSTDNMAIFAPTSYTFVGSDAGTHTFGATLRTAGVQSITATDMGSGFIA